MSQDAADVGFLGESPGPIWAFGVAAEHHREAMFALRGASNYVFLALQTEQAWWLPEPTAKNTVHLELGPGTENVTVYGVLNCNWLREFKIAGMVTVDAELGTGVSIFGLRSAGAEYAVNQGGVEQMNQTGVGWLAVCGPQPK